MPNCIGFFIKPARESERSGISKDQAPNGAVPDFYRKTYALAFGQRGLSFRFGVTGAATATGRSVFCFFRFSFGAGFVGMTNPPF